MCKTTILPALSKESENEHQWHAMTFEEAASTLGLSKDIRSKGLSTSEAKKRLEEYGPNQLSEKERKSLLRRIWNLLCNVLVGILVFVAIVSLIKGIISEGESRVTNFIEVGLITFVVT
jgi:magnesium-transporting ATPase (P-type)